VWTPSIGQPMADVFDGDPAGPWYEAAEPGWEAFCIADTAHQAMGAHALELVRRGLGRGRLRHLCVPRLRPLAVRLGVALGAHRRPGIARDSAAPADSADHAASIGTQAPLPDLRFFRVIAG